MTQPQGTDLAEHLALLRRRKLLFSGCLLLGVMTSGALCFLLPPTYTATTQVLVAPTGVQEQNNQVTPRQRESLNLDTEAQIAQSAVVRAKAAQATGGTTIEPPAITVPPNSAVLSISVTSGDPATAAARSKAYADAYLANRTETAQAELAARLKTLYAKLKQVNSSLSDVVEDIEKLTKGTAERTIATHRQTVLSRQVASLTAKYDSLKTVAVTPGTVISQAVPPAERSSPSIPMLLGTGLMAGLLAGVGTAYVRDRLDTRLRTAADVERLTGLPVLADFTGDVDLHDLTSSLVASCPDQRLLVRAVPNQPHEPLPVELALLDGSDVRDLSRADAAILLITLRQATSQQVAAAVRHLQRHRVPVVGALAQGASPARVDSAPKALETAPIPVVPDSP
ncbi:YveK family protein [Nonomuraea sp. NPDC050663]|uniref:YveK family protein n=1 Tax=Nonomuraea sp. NPDC050663 TaxID=3364370 RepID=UPI0037BC6DCE